MKYVHALNQALHEILEDNPNVYLLGEDLLDPYGGAFKVTNGLSSRFPDRVVPTPLSEHAMIGIAGGMALRGLIPIVEIMFGDFITLGMDQILNHITKYRTMYGGSVRVPLIIRTPMGGGRGYGPTHSQSLEKYCLGIPGLKVIAPSKFHQPGELLKQAVKVGEPVLFIEHKLLYPLELTLPDENAEDIKRVWLGDDRFPVALVKNYNMGNPDVILLTYGGGSRLAEELLKEMKQEEIKVLAYIPCLINRVDWAGLRQAGSLDDAVWVILEEGTQGFGWGAEMAAQLFETFELNPKWLKRLSALPTVIPASQTLEQHVLPGVPQLRSAMMDLLDHKYQSA